MREAGAAEGALDMGALCGAGGAALGMLTAFELLLGALMMGAALGDEGAGIATGATTAGVAVGATAGDTGAATDELLEASAAGAARTA